MLIKLHGGNIIDPVNGKDCIGDLWIRDGRIISVPKNADILMGGSALLTVYPAA